MRELTEARPIDITGALCPFRQDEQPVLVVMEGHYYVPTFSDVDRLREHMRILGMASYRIKRVGDGAEFAHSILGGGQCGIMHNPRIELRDGRPVTQWTEIVITGGARA